MALFGYIFRRSVFACILVAFWLPFGPLLAPFGSLLAPLGALLAPLGALLAHFGALLAPLGALLAHFGSLLAHFALFWVGFANAEATFSNFFCLLPSFQHFLEFSTKIAFKIYVSFENCHALAPESAQHQRQNQQARKTVAP